MVFRCPTVKREEAFNSIGESLLAILFHVLERCISIDGDESDSIMSHVLQILYYFSRVRPAATEMVQNPCMMPCFIHIILGDKNDSIRAKALVTLADLSCVEENGPIIAKHQVLLDAVVQVASLDLALEMREVATRAIQNIDFNPLDKSEAEVQRFCQSYMTELCKYVGPDVDHLLMGMGVSEKELGYLFGQCKRLNLKASSVRKKVMVGDAFHAPGYAVAHYA